MHPRLRQADSISRLWSKVDSNAKCAVIVGSRMNRHRCEHQELCVTPGILETFRARSVLAMGFSRRHLLASTALFLLGGLSARAAINVDSLPWAPNAGSPPVPVKPGPWLFFSGAEGRAVEAIVDRIIPTDPKTPGGKDAGCAVFIDRQLAGPYGRNDGLYIRPPFQKGAKIQGHQSEKGPMQEYREGLAALDKACKAQLGGKAFFELSDADKDRVLSGLESGEFKF